MLGLALLLVALAAGPAAADLVSSFSGIFTDANSSGDMLTFPANTTGINDPSGDLTGATVNALTGTLSGGGDSLSQLSLAYTSGDVTYDINFTLTDVTVTPEMFSFDGFTLYYGLISATIPVGGVSVTPGEEPLTGTLNSDLLGYTDFGGNFGLTYNGILIGSDSAVIEAAPSASFTVAPNSDPAPEPSTIVLTLTGAAALALQRLARQLRERALTETDAPPDS